MAGRNSKKSQNNFEKIKREMSRKKQKAESQNIPDASTADIENAEAKQEKIEMVVFRVREEEFAFILSNVKEIIRVPGMTKVPGAPVYIAGLCSLRGELLPVIDSRKLFGIPAKEYNESSRIIVADIHGKKVGMISDKVSEVLSTEEINIKEPPESIRGIDGGVVNGILVLDNGKRIIMILDAEKIVKAGEFDSHANYQKGLSKMELAGSNTKVEEEQIIVFAVGNEEYGIRINHVQEINRMSELVRFPGAPAFIDGMVDLRGEVIPILNLRTLFAITDICSLDSSKFLVIEYHKKKIGIMIDSVSEVLRFSRELLEGTPEVISANDKNRYVDSIAKLNDGKRAVLILNLAAVLNFM